jgi:hypothetical protein
MDNIGLYISRKVRKVKETQSAQWHFFSERCETLAVFA